MQLDLFEGIILTPEQQEKKQKKIAYENRTTASQKSKSEEIEKLLIEGGFVKGVDYVNDFKTTHIVEDVTLGYGDNEFTTEIEYTGCEGSCKIIYDLFYNGKLEKGRHAHVCLQNNKLECTAITSQYRYYLPSSLKLKLENHNLMSLGEYNRYKKDIEVKVYTINKYQKLYPTSVITEDTVYLRLTSNYARKIIKVLFENGSFIKLYLPLSKDEETIYRVYNSCLEGMESIEEKMNYLNNQ